jgi:transposase-like protein
MLSRIKIHAMKKIIFVDETLLKVDGIEYWLWIAYEPKLNSCLMMLYPSRERRTIFFVCYRFFKQLRDGMAVGNPYSQMVIAGTMTHTNG